MIAQSAFRCSLFDTVCSASRGPPLAVGVAGFTALTASFALAPSALRFSSSSCTVRAEASSFLCRGVDAKTRRDESRSNEDGEGRARRVCAVHVRREHGTKPGRKSSRLANMLYVLIEGPKLLRRPSPSPSVAVNPMAGHVYGCWRLPVWARRKRVSECEFKLRQ